MSDSASSRPAVEANWLDWVNANLGGPPDRAERAADAARAAVHRGEGLNAAMAAATNRWLDGGHGQKPFWELTFWGVLWQRPEVLAYVLFVLFAQVFWFVPLGGIAVVALSALPLGAAVWNIYVAYRLSNHGVVAHGELVDVSVRDSDGDVHVGKYVWHFQGPQLTTRAGSTPQTALILFDPAFPRDAVVIDRSFSRSA